MLEWINVIVLFFSMIFFSYFYLLSIQPVKRERNRGVRAWKECYIFRFVSWVFNLLMVINVLLWIWLPVPNLDWKVASDHITSIIAGLIFSIPFSIILIKGVVDAGKETLQPSRKTKLYGGIYNYIRHPQTLGEFPLFIALGFIVNSLFIIFIMTFFILVFTPIMISLEEKDLLRKFGNNYREYQKGTGAIFPRIIKNDESI